MARLVIVANNMAPFYSLGHLDLVHVVALTQIGASKF
jgi:hypothetical protein